MEAANTLAHHAITTVSPTCRTGGCCSTGSTRPWPRPLRPGRPWPLLYLDLNGFKQINDTLGHEAGDELLVAVATALHRSVRGSDCAGRLGGDEFVAVVTQIESPDDAHAVARRVQAEIEQPVSINGSPVIPHASIGVAIAPPERDDAERLLHHADVAMYHAKRARNTGWQMYVDGMHDPAHPTRHSKTTCATRSPPTSYGCSSSPSSTPPAAR